MIRESVLIFTIGQFGLCSSSPTEEPTPSGFTCSDYQIMVDVELKILRECSSNSECDVFLDGIDSDCDEQPPILSNEISSEYMYDLLEEADLYGCSIEIKTNDVCSESAYSSCVSGACAWVD